MRFWSNLHALPRQQEARPDRPRKQRKAVQDGHLAHGAFRMVENASSLFAAGTGVASWNRNGNNANGATAEAMRILSKAETMTIFELQNFVRFALRLVMTKGGMQQRTEVIKMVRVLNELKKEGACENPTRQLFANVVNLLTAAQLRVIWANALSPMALARIESEQRSDRSDSPLSTGTDASEDGGRCPSDDGQWTEEKLNALHHSRVNYVAKLYKDSGDKRMPLVLRRLFAHLTEQCNEEQRMLAGNALTQLRRMRADGKLEMMTVELYHAFERILDDGQVNAAWMTLRKDAERDAKAVSKRSAREMEAATELVMLTGKKVPKRPRRAAAT